MHRIGHHACVDGDADGQSSGANDWPVRTEAEASAIVRRVGLLKGEALMVYEARSPLSDLLMLPDDELRARAEHAYKVLLDKGVLPPPFDGRRDAG
jgi:hypothetical protein